MLSPEQVATILDGEGTIRSGINYTVPQPNVRLGMTDPFYPQALLEQFGGRIHVRRSKNPRHKDLYDWYLYGKDCEAVLIYALPHLKVKRQQARIVLLLVTLVKPDGKHSTSDADMILQWRLHDMLKELNRRGKPQVDQQQEVTDVRYLG